MTRKIKIFLKNKKEMDFEKIYKRWTAKDFKRE